MAKCFVCKKNESDTAHHISYDPVIMMNVCNNCHERIHYGDYFLLCPKSSKEFCWENNSIYGSNIEAQADTMPEHLRKYVRIAYESILPNDKNLFILSGWKYKLGDTLEPPWGTIFK